MKVMYINGERVENEDDAIQYIGSLLSDYQCKRICELNISYERAWKMSSVRRRECAGEIFLNKLRTSGWVQVDDNINDECNWMNDESLGVTITYKEE